MHIRFEVLSYCFVCWFILPDVMLSSISYTSTFHLDYLKVLLLFFYRNIIRKEEEMTVVIAFKLRCITFFNIPFHYFRLQPKSDLEMLISTVLSRNNWHMSLYKFKVYGMMIWSTYIVKWLSQQIQLTTISHKDTIKRNENSKKFFLLLELLYFFIL